MARNTYGIAPVYLHGMDAIQRACRRRRSTIVAWSREGAPVFKNGRRWVAELNSLYAWIREREQGSADQ